MENAAGNVISVPNHPELDLGMLRRLVRDAKLSVEEFIAMLK
jgi:predicted RNA binding protein YcfA (HicA-like mRNA interferase family)